MPTTDDIRTTVQAVERSLSQTSDSPRADAELLLEYVLGLSRGSLLLHERDVVEGERRRQLDELVQRRSAGEPIAYLIGTCGFWKLDLVVTPAVLIPRPDTETLVEWALECAGPAAADARIADLGTGSGAIALAIALERPRANVVATDLSVDALRLARANAARNGITSVAFRAGDWFQALPPAERFDLIVSNPPYVADGDPHLPALKHEPIGALVSGVDGLDALRVIAAGARAWLKSGGRLLVEHGYDQGPAVRSLFELAGFADVITRRDLGDNERITGGRAP